MGILWPWFCEAMEPSLSGPWGLHSLQQATDGEGVEECQLKAPGVSLGGSPVAFKVGRLTFNGGSLYKGHGRRKSLLFAHLPTLSMASPLLH